MANLLKVTFQGALPAGDVFQHSFVSDWTFEPSMSAAAGKADDALAALLGGDANLKGYYQAETVWTAPLVTLFDSATGDTIDALNGVGTAAGDHVGGTNLPGEVAACVTLRTATESKSTRGRMYLPAPGNVALTNDGRFTTAFQEAVVGGVQQAFVAWLDGEVTGVPVVYSGLHHTYAAITSAECGNIPDAQRRRRNALTETRFSGPV